jgi:co-chaperonin GroES (HSP10)
MKAIGRNLIILVKKEGTTETKGGLLLSENQKNDLRYRRALVISVGNEVDGVKENDEIFFDRHAGHKIEFEKNIYHVIKSQDVVVVV